MKKNIMDYSRKYSGSVKSGCSKVKLLTMVDWKKVVWYITKKIQVTPRVLSPASTYEGKKVLKQIHSYTILRWMR